MNKILKAIIDLKMMAVDLTGAMSTADDMGVECIRQKIESIDIALVVLDKRVPRKPKFDNDEIWHCPRCNARYNLEVDGNIAYCPNCGQKIDWGEDSEIDRR